MKLHKVAVVSKVGSKDSEQAGRDVVKKLLAKKIAVYTISPIEVKGAKKVETLEELKKMKLDLVVTLGGDGTTLRVFRNLKNETPILTINVGGNRGILSEITIKEFDGAIDQILKGKIFLDKRVRVLPVDLREYGIGAQVLHYLGVRRMMLLTNNPKKIHGLAGYGLEIVDQRPLETEPNPVNIKYLRTKRDKMGHTLSGRETPVSGADRGE